MLFPNRLKNPKTLVFWGMLLLAFSLNLPYLFHPSAQAGRNLLEAVRGLLMGISIGFNLMGARLAARQRRSCGN